MSKKVEITEHDGTRMLVFDGEVFDWGVEDTELKRAKSFCRNHPGLSEGITGSIQQHLLCSLSEFLGRDVTLAELNQAIKNGEID